MPVRDIGTNTVLDRSTSSSTMDETTNEAALARKRRIAMRNQQRSSTSGAITAGEEDLDSDSCAAERESKRARFELDDDELSFVEADSVTSKPKPHITGIKKQSRYDPGVTMTRDELKSWRKEARRVRNRESAAASRQKNRERITELETEVDEIKQKYAAALKLIIDLEGQRSMNDSFTPSLLRQDMMNMRGGLFPFDLRPASPVSVSDADSASSRRSPAQTVSPPSSPATPPAMVSTMPGTVEDLCLHHYNDVSHHQHREAVNNKYQHIIDMISRPIACV